MNDAANARPAGKGKAGETNPAAPPSPEQRSAFQRRPYIKTRLPEIQEEINRLNGERESLSTPVEAAVGSKEGKQIRLKRSYVATRLKMLREEQKTLNTERKNLRETLGKAGIEGGKEKAGAA